MWLMQWPDKPELGYLSCANLTFKWHKGVCNLLVVHTAHWAAHIKFCKTREGLPNHDISIPMIMCS